MPDKLRALERLMELTGWGRNKDRDPTRESPAAPEATTPWAEIEAKALQSPLFAEGLRSLCDRVEKARRLPATIIEG